MQYLPSGDSFSRALNFENFVSFVWIRKTFGKGRLAERFAHYSQKELYYFIIIYYNLLKIRLIASTKVNNNFREKTEPVCVCVSGDKKC